jgi:lipoyl(octanoyl) transferase
MLDLRSRRQDVRAFVAALEEWIIRSLGRLQRARRTSRDDRVGVWVVRPDRPPSLDGSPAEDKIAAIGIRLRKWVSFHGIAIKWSPIWGTSAASCPAACETMA